MFQKTFLDESAREQCGESMACKKKGNQSGNPCSTQQSIECVVLVPLVYLIGGVFVADNAREHGCYILRVSQSDELIAVEGQRQELNPMHDTVEEPIEVIALVGQGSVDVLWPGKGSKTTLRETTKTSHGPDLGVLFNKNRRQYSQTRYGHGIVEQDGRQKAYSTTRKM